MLALYRGLNIERCAEDGRHSAHRSYPTAALAAVLPATQEHGVADSTPCRADRDNSPGGKKNQQGRDHRDARPGDVLIASPSCPSEYALVLEPTHEHTQVGEADEQQNAARDESFSNSKCHGEISHNSFLHTQ